MELQLLIDKLRNERIKMDEIIASLEKLEQTKAEARPFLKSRRGRKFMQEAERKQVSTRMKNYWATRRATSGR